MYTIVEIFLWHRKIAESKLRMKMLPKPYHQNKRGKLRWRTTRRDEMMSASIWSMSTETFALCILRWKSIAPLNRWNRPFKNCNSLCLESLPGLPLSKTLLGWTADEEKITLCQYAHSQLMFGKTNDLKCLMKWLLMCPDIKFIVHWNLCVQAVPCKVYIFSTIMQRYSIMA